jgi:hypothetical protein
MTMNDGHESSREYHHNRVEIGAIYATKENSREVVTQWAMSTQRIFRTNISSPKYLTIAIMKLTLFVKSPTTIYCEFLKLFLSICELAYCCCVVDYCCNEVIDL